MICLCNLSFPRVIMQYSVTSALSSLSNFFVVNVAVFSYRYHSYPLTTQAWFLLLLSVVIKFSFSLTSFKLSLSPKHHRLQVLRQFIKLCICLFRCIFPLSNISFDIYYLSVHMSFQFIFSDASSGLCKEVTFSPHP